MLALNFSLLAICPIIREIKLIVAFIFQKNISTSLTRKNSSRYSELCDPFNKSKNALTIVKRQYLSSKVTPNIIIEIYVVLKHQVLLLNNWAELVTHFGSRILYYKFCRL